MGKVRNGLAAAVILIFTGWLPLRAQKAPSTSWDSDIRTFRFNIDPGFRHSYDDYLQYSPGVLMLTLKSLGYESRSDWDRMAVSDALSAGIFLVAGNGIKWAVDRTRPDGGHHSFPSGHTGTAFMAATMLHHEYGWRSPWWSMAGYTAATVTSMSRVMNDRHWMSDTFAGAVLGVCSTELGYWITDRIFKGKGLTAAWRPSSFLAEAADNEGFSIQAGYDRRFILADRALKDSGEVPLRGAGASLIAEVPVAGGFGICAEGAAGVLIFNDSSSLNVYGGKAGAFWSLGFARMLEFEVQAMLGYAGNKECGGLDCSTAASLNLLTGDNFKLRARAGWESLPATGASCRRLNSILLGYSAAFCW